MSGKASFRDDLSTLGGGFRHARRQLKWSQSELAKRAGISRDTIHRLEQGGVVDSSSLLKLATAMGHRLALVSRERIRATDMRERFAHLHEDAE